MYTLNSKESILQYILITHKTVDNYTRIYCCYKTMERLVVILRPIILCICKITPTIFFTPWWLAGTLRLLRQLL